MNPMNQKTLILSIPIMLAVLLLGGWFLLRGQKGVQNVPKQPTTSEMEEDLNRKNSDSSQMLENDFRSKLGNSSRKKVFSIPISANIPSFCPDCESRGIDSIEGQYWEFSVSGDGERYAYIASDNKGKEFVILDGVAQKSYDSVYFLHFNLDGKIFSYHAYDKGRDETFLVKNGEEISVYAGPEGYPQAANGVSEAFGPQGQFAFARVTKEAPRTIEIFKNGELINTIPNALMVFDMRFIDNGQRVEYTILNEDLNNRYNRYVDGTMTMANVGQDPHPERVFDTLKTRSAVFQDNSVVVGDRKIADYSGKEFEDTYLSSLSMDAAGKNVAYVLWKNVIPKKQEVSLNGNETGEFFNEIKYLEFGNDGKTIKYVGRIGRTVYFVTHALVD